MITWQQRLLEAFDTEQLMWIVKDFISSWHPEEISALPGGCLPGRLEDGDDVAGYALKLTQCQCGADATNAALQRMTTFFSAASQRVSQLMALTAPSAANDHRIAP